MLKTVTASPSREAVLDQWKSYVELKLEPKIGLEPMTC